ncbi:RNA-directed DNA polymerase, eukaryota [Tanacetum coccineum]
MDVTQKICLIFTVSLIKKQKNLNDGPKSNDTMKYPPGFTPMTNADSQSNDLKGVGKEGDETLKNDQEEKQNSEVRKPSSINNSKEDREESICSGYSGGILCVWDPRLFLKVNFTIFDYFVMIRGEWIFNVRTPAERYVSIFSVQGANAFNSFISSTGLEEFEMEEFEIFVERTWSEIQTTDPHDIVKFMKKMKCLKEKIRAWIKTKKENSYIQKKNLKADLAKIDLLLDKGEGDFDILNKRVYVSKSLQDIEKMESMEVAQKAKIKWAIEGDENSKYYHGNLYKIIAKILANHLVVVLRDIVNEVQYAFIANRQILDGPFILNEVYQWCKKQKKHTMIFKVDFKKAYDSVR